MNVLNTQRRQEVLEIYRWSVAQVASGAVEEVAGWDCASSWHNSLFREQASGRQWVVYLPDHAWPGEVRLLAGGSEPG